MFIAVANGDKGSVECVNDDCDDQHMVIIVGRACSLYLLDLYYILFSFFINILIHHSILIIGS